MMFILCWLLEDKTGAGPSSTWIQDGAGWAGSLEKEPGEKNRNPNREIQVGPPNSILTQKLH